MLTSLQYFSESPLPACEGGELGVGDSVQLKINQVNPDWPKKVLGIVSCVRRTSCGGRKYTVVYDDTGLSTFVPKQCFYTLSAYCCCDKLEDVTDHDVCDYLPSA